MIFRLRIYLRSILSMFKGWEIISMNIIKGIEDELMQNKGIEKEKREMKRYDDKKLREIIFSLIIIYNNIYIYIYENIARVKVE